MGNETADDAFQDVLTVAIDSRNGYKEAAKDAESQSLGSFFASMVAFKQRHISELEGLLRDRGVTPDESGSFLTTINRAIFSFRSVFGGVDENVIPGLIDGESRIVGYYDEAILVALGAGEREVLLKHRQELQQMIDTMRAMQAKTS